MRPQVAKWVLPAYVASCLLLGGASAAGVLANGLLQLLAVGLIAHHFWRNRTVTRDTGERWSVNGIFWLVAIFALWVVVQLVPLPSQLWQALPGRDLVEDGDALLGMSGLWRPLAMQPDRVLISAMSILPPFAVFLLTLRATAPIRSATIYAILAIAIFSSAIGLVQVSHGPASPAYLYDFTNANTSVGFFSNANHLATLFVISLVLTADIPFRPVADRQKTFWFVIRTVLMLFMLVNVLINRSQAGFVLLIPALLFWLARTQTGLRWFGPVRQLWMALAGIALLVPVAALWWGERLFQNVALNTVGITDRLAFIDTSRKIIADNFPIGGGLGSFRWLYAGYEDLTHVARTYVNHAHNDYVEFLVEGGVVAVILIAGLAIWWGWRMLSLLRLRRILPDHVYAAATIILLVACHSLVDYPVRTAAIAAICGMCLGVLARPAGGTDASRHISSARRHRR